MSSYQETHPPLETLLALRHGAEEAAARQWQLAAARRDAAEAQQDQLDAAVKAARDELRGRRRTAGAAGTAAAGAARERYWDRLRDEIAARVASAAAHRAGPLAAARAEAAAAFAAHRTARGARELVEKLCQKADSARRRVEARRAEQAGDEQGQIAAARRAINPARPPSSRGSSVR